MSTSVTPASGRAHATAIFIGLLAALAGLMFGLDIGVISGATQFIRHDFGIDDHTLELIVSSMMGGAAIGALVSGFLSALLGRKRSLIIAAILFVIGSVLSAVAPSPGALMGARVVLGFAIGIATFTAPLYLAEISSERSRGAMVSTYQLMITIGILIAFLSDTAFSYSGNWRWMLGVIAIPGALFLIGVVTLPESPRWLVMRGFRERATAVLARLRGSANVQQELSDIEAQLKTPQSGLRLFLDNRNFRRSVGLGIVLQVMQQFTGMNVVMYYAPIIFKDMGYATEQQMWFTALVGLINVLATFIAISLVDRWGRKPILYIGFSVMAIGLGVVGAMMHLGIATHAEQLFTVAMLLLFIVGFAMSAGPLIWTLCSEIQPLKGRDFGIACSTVTNWIANMIVGATFLTLLNHFGHAHTFWLYAGLNVLFLIITIAFVPETRGVTLEQIERNLLGGKRLRHIGR
ncbi:MAG: sugar porter family MFS transporter [Rhodanobacteraceae bacterium]|nr:MAG: sugar porter family MFS transporter [Rhodanobacteraceae bacterium]